MLLALALLASLQACATTPSGGGARLGTPEAARGYRALFRVGVEGPGGKSHFRMAVALMPPDRLRLEFFGPIGGPRLVVASDGASAIALLPADRAYESGRADPERLDRLLGLPLTPAELVALLTGRPMCSPEAAEQRMETKAAATFGRTLAWYEVHCPPGEIRYEARCQERGGALEQASVREGISGAMILEVEYDDHQEGLGPRWPRRIRLRFARQQANVELAAQEGPMASDVPESIFSPPVPDGFEQRALLDSPAAPGLLGSTAGRER